jgi:hypothetical protein
MTAKQLAYGNSQMGNTTSSTYRTERSVPFMRRGVTVTVVPRFKGLFIYPLSPAQVPSVFQQTVTNVNAPPVTNASAGTRTRWPVGPGKQVVNRS